MSRITRTAQRLISMAVAAALMIPSLMPAPASAIAVDSGNTIASATVLGVGSRTESINRSTDQYDVFSVVLQENQKYAVKLTTTAPAGVLDIDLDLYPPGSLVLESDPTVFYSANPYVYPEAMTYVVPPGAGGTYYLAVRADAGYGPYTLQSKIDTATPDDEIPGIEAASPVSRSLDRYGNQDDVFRVFVEAGETLRASLSGPATTDFDLFAYSPDAKSVLTTKPSAESTGLTSAERVELVSQTSDWHFLDVYSAYGAGTYKLSYEVGLPTAIALKAPGVIGYGAAATVSGRLTQGGSDLSTKTVTLEYRNYGATSWAKMRDVSTDASGTFSASVRPKYRTEYRARYAGVPGELLSTTSATKVVKPRVALSAPNIPRGIRPGSAFTVTGVVKPRYPQGARVVRIQAQRYEGGKWVTRRWATATTLKPGTTASWFRASMSVPYRGRWRVRAVLPTNSRNAYSTGSPTYFSVR